MIVFDNRIPTMSNPDDFSYLEAIVFWFTHPGGETHYIFNDRFGMTLEIGDLKTTLANDDPIQELLPDTKLLPALRKTVA